MPTKSSASPQRVQSSTGEVFDVWPEHWGISVSQVAAFVDECRSDPRWRRENTMRDLVENYVMPLTAGTGVGYALHVNQRDVKEVGIMVSHSWNENVEEFVDTLQRSLPHHENLFICSLSIFQNCDGSGPSIAEQLGSDAHDSPFYRVLQHIRDKGSKAGWRWQPSRPARRLAMLCFTVGMGGHFAVAHAAEGADFCDQAPLIKLDRLVCLEGGLSRRELVFTPIFLALHLACIAFTSISALLYLYDQTMDLYRGRMVAVPNREDLLYSRLWCVYEMFVADGMGIYVEMARSFAPVGECICRDASCSNEEDRSRIRNEIEAWGSNRAGDADGGYAHLDATISALTRAATRLYVICCVCIVVMSMCWTIWQQRLSRLVLAHQAIVIAMDSMCNAWHLYILYVMLKHSKGHLTLPRCLLSFVPSFIFGIALHVFATILGRTTDIGVIVGMTAECFVQAANFVVFLLITIHCTPVSARHGMKRSGCFFLIFTVLQTLQILIYAALQKLPRHTFNAHVVALFVKLSFGPLFSCAMWSWMVSWGAKTCDYRVFCACRKQAQACSARGTPKNTIDVEEPCMSDLTPDGQASQSQLPDTKVSL